LIIEGATKCWSVDLHLTRISYSCLAPFGITWVSGRSDTLTAMFFNISYIPVPRTRVPPCISVERWCALWTCDRYGGSILGLGFRFKNATAPLYLSFSLCLSEIFNWIDCRGFVRGAHLLPAVLPIMVCLSSLPRYLLHVVLFL
jgi:hypothetical protein